MKRSDPKLDQRVRRFLQFRGIQPHEESTSVYARLEHGRWLADCLCGGAEYVREVASFICGTCGAVREVVWPKNVAAIEAAVEMRERPNQNWIPGETVPMLHAENLEHGVG